MDTFPTSMAEALAMLYVEKQNIEGLSPTELLAMYQTAYEEITDRLHEQYSERFEQL